LDKCNTNILSYELCKNIYAFKFQIHLRAGSFKGGKNKMCEVLDRAINEGRCEGRCEGLISVCKDFKLSYEQTAAKLKEKFQLSDQEIEKSMKLYW
jgi:hypothetical protein